MKLKTGHLVIAKLNDRIYWNHGYVMHPPVYIKLCDGRPPHYIDEFKHIQLDRFQPIDNEFEIIGVNKFLCVECKGLFDYKEAERHSCKNQLD